MNPNPTLTDLDTALENLTSARSAYQAAVDAREKHIIKLHSQKTTPINQLAENAEVSRQWVTRLLRGAKIPTHGHNRHLPHTTSTKDLTTLRELASAVTTTQHASEEALTERNRIINHLIHNAGHSQGSIARHTGISRATIGRITTT